MPIPLPAARPDEMESVNECVWFCLALLSYPNFLCLNSSCLSRVIRPGWHGSVAEGRPRNQEVTVPDQGTGLGCELEPQCRVYRRQPIHDSSLMFLSLSASEINKNI